MMSRTLISTNLTSLVYSHKDSRHKCRTVQAGQHASTHQHTGHQTPTERKDTHPDVGKSGNLPSNSPDFLKVGSWAKLRSQTALINTLQAAMEQVHPNWECLTRKCLNQLVNKRVHPSPRHLDHRPSLQPTPLLRPSRALVEEIHLCRLVARLVSAHRSK